MVSPFVFGFRELWEEIWREVLLMVLWLLSELQTSPRLLLDKEE